MDYYLKLMLFGIILFIEVKGHRKILLKDVGALTLHKGAYTTGRRSSPIPQLQCVGGSAGCDMTPKFVQCQNVGYDGYDVQWECKANMDKRVSFGKLDVVCEGFDYPDDPYILVGSCGLEYQLELTSAGKDAGYYRSKRDGGFTPFFIFVIIIVCIALYYFWTHLSNANQPPLDPPSYNSDNFSSHSPPPPPYSDHSSAPPPPGFKGFQRTTNNTHHHQQGTQNQQNQQGYQRQQQRNEGAFGGFWTGAGVGSLLGYIFGSRNNNYNHQDTRGWGNNWWSGTQRNHGEGWGNWWRSNPGNIGGTQRRRGWFEGGQTSNDSTSSTDHTSSGFGGTNRR